jgi:hypothetical protein
VEIFSKKNKEHTKTQYESTEEEIKLSELSYNRFKDSMVAKSEYTKKWKECYDAYFGNYKNKNKPIYKSDVIVNHIFKTIETVRPIMIDNNPKFIALARTETGIAKSEVIQKSLDYEWDREAMRNKLPQALIPALVTGNAIFFLGWDGKDNKIGNIKCKLIDAFNFYCDPLAYDLESAEYVIYATYKHFNQLKKKYPKKSSAITGAQVKYSELVQDRDKNAVKQNNQVLVLEMWCRDYTTIEKEYEEDGNKLKQISAKYPRGRVITTTPELNLVLEDKPNPYKHGKFPFVMLKDYDIPFEFWGRGDVEQLISPQSYINELNNQITDNAKNTGNMQWIVDNNAGIPKGTLTNRPGLIVRKNPGTEVRRDSPPPMPGYINDKVQEWKTDIQTISGVHETLAGERAPGVQAGNAIMALQEASQTRIRLKVKMMENALSDLASMWYELAQQFWKIDRFVRVTNEEGSYDFENIKTTDLENDYDIKVTAGSTMPSNKTAKLDLMIRLAQTMGEDGLPMVDRKSVMQFVDMAGKQEMLQRMEDIKQGAEQQLQAQQQAEGQAQQQQAMFEQIVQVVQELQGEVQKLSNEVAKIEQEKEAEDEEKAIQEREGKAYEKGLKEIPPDIDDEKRIAMEILREQGGNMPQEEDDFTNSLNNGIIPDEALDELNNLPPEQLMALLEQYPQLEEMINKQ